MSSVYFAKFPHSQVNPTFYDDLKKILQVDEVLSLIPITRKEATHAAKKGMESLLNKFEEQEISPNFNFFRQSLI